MATQDTGVMVKPSRRVYSTEPQMYPEVQGAAQDNEPPPHLPFMVQDNGPPAGRVYPPKTQTSASDAINTLMYSFQN